MKRYSGWMLSLSLVFGPALPGLGTATGTLPPDHHVNAAAGHKAAPVTAADETLALLPKSDAVLLFDAGRLINDVLPKIKAAWPQQSGRLTQELDDLTSRTGVDLSKVKTITMGFNMSGKTTTGAVILDGLTLDQSKLDALLKEVKAEKTGTVSYKSKTIYLVKAVKKEEKKDGDKADKENTRQPTSTSAESLVGTVTDTVGLKLDDETAFTQLDQTRVVLGDQVGVKAVIDAAASPTPNLNNALNGALKETRATGLIRFAISIPESTRQMLAGQDYFKDLAAVQMVSGALDVSDELSLLLDAKLRTPSPAEASKIEASLNGLVAIGKMMLGGNQEPLMQALTQLLNEIKIGAQTSDVTLGLKIPRALFDQAFKADPKKAGSQK
ncbi:MAG: hypothetical protein U0Z53_09450 [Blastocatellia bacterium]